MPRCILRLGDKYFEWSTVVDAPVTYAMTLAELEAYMKDEYGKSGLRDLAERLKRVADSGCSFIGITAQELINGNRAGDGGAELTEVEIVSRYAAPFSFETRPKVGTRERRGCGSV